MEPPLPAASTDGTQVTEFHCHPANTFDAIARVKTMLPGNMAGLIDLMDEMFAGMTLEEA